MEKIELDNKSDIDEGQITSSPIEERTAETDGRLKHPFPILLIAFTTATLIDLLFFEKMWGWHWAVAANLFLIAVVVSSRLEDKKIPKTSITLMALTSLSALLTGFRSASATTTALVLVSGLGMLLVTASLLNGQWMQFRLRELIGELFKLIPSWKAFRVPRIAKSRIHKKVNVDWQSCVVC